jgi:hypothetical protein
MSVDTREKRFSMLNFGDGTHVHATFEADGAIDADDRQHLLDCYSGIAFAAPAVVVFVEGITDEWIIEDSPDWVVPDSSDWEVESSEDWKLPK